MALALFGIVLLMSSGSPAAAAGADPGREVRNLTISGQRAAVLADPAFAARYAAEVARHTAERLALRVRDPERNPDPNFCTITPVCEGDVRLYDWDGRVEPVLFTARSGATLSGHVWAARAGAAKRPGVLVINGSIAGFERAYWWAARALAEAGYVVLTFDVQGEGDSDQFGEAPDVLEGSRAGLPVLGDGLPFYDGGTDALDFFLSTPDSPYVPRASRTSGTSHAGKQSRRVAAGLNSAYNPLWRLVDPGSLGVTGHSFGAIAASYLGQSDPRLDAVVAWDSLCTPVQPAPDELPAFLRRGPDLLPGLPTPAVAYGFDPECFSAPPGPQPVLRKPALGINGDYLLTPTPYLTPPDPGFKARSSRAYSAAGVDTGNITIRGGTHLEQFFVPLPAPGASLRGIDLSADYTVAWFDKYLKRDPGADARLLTDRWRDDPATRAVDPDHDGNLFSYHYRSRLDVHLADGTRLGCEDLRAGCSPRPGTS